MQEIIGCTNIETVVDLNFCMSNQIGLNRLEIRLEWLPPPRRGQPMSDWVAECTQFISWYLENSQLLDEVDEITIGNITYVLEPKNP